MGRPSNWWPLGHVSDPVPGEPTIVQNAAAEYRLVAEAIDRAARNLEQLVRGDGHVSEAVRALVGQAEQIVDRIDRAEDKYEGVANALSAYVSPLAQAQAWSIEALASATNAQAAIDNADDAIRRNLYAEDDSSMTAEELARNENKREDLYSDRASAENVLASAVELLQKAINHRDSAAATAADAIDDVEQASKLNDGFWDNLDQFLDENSGWIDIVLNVLGVIAGILVLVAMFVPGLNVLVLTIFVIAVAVLSIVHAISKSLTGNQSWAETVVDVGLALIPFGVGKLVGSGASAIHSGTRAAAITSQMRSAAGQGISGMTTQAAARLVDGVARSAAPALKTIGSDMRLAVEARAMAGIPLASGMPSAHVTSAGRAWMAPILMGVWTLNEVVWPVLSTVVPVGPPKALIEKTTHTMRDTNW